MTKSPLPKSKLTRAEFLNNLAGRLLVVGVAVPEASGNKSKVNWFLRMKDKLNLRRRQR